MQPHEREFFSFKIRLGTVNIDNYVVYPPTAMQQLEACCVYNDAFESAQSDGIMTESQMLAWMIDQGFWHKSEDLKLEEIKKEIEDTKVEIYKSFLIFDEKYARNLKFTLRRLHNIYLEQGAKKTDFFTNTCEAFADLEKNDWIISNTTFLNNEKYDFSNNDLHHISLAYQKSILSEKIIREIARSEPWKSTWSLHQKIGKKLFTLGDEYELTFNQKSLLVWSSLYDNIKESLDCPTDKIIEDDDALDGWFIDQNRKREREVDLDAVSKTLGRNVNKNEVFVVARDEEHAKKIHGLNSQAGRQIIKNRSEQIRKQGSVEYHHLKDKQLEYQQQVNKLS